MAIIPKSKYPAQTEVNDPGYPNGKARNVGTPGDGSGTPWEADLVNDIWGFQQALLAAGGLAPSNTPDKVGASQYLTAVNNIVRAATSLLAGTLYQTVSFLEKSYQWKGSHGFAESVGVFDAFVVGGDTNEITYGDDLGSARPRLRTRMLPILNGREGLQSAQWSHLAILGNPSSIVSVVDNAVLVLSFNLPHESKLTRVRVALSDGHGAAFDVQANQIRTALSPPYQNAGTTLGTDTQTFAADGLISIDTSATALLTNGAQDVFQVTLVAHAAAQAITFCEVQFADPGPRNF